MLNYQQVKLPQKTTKLPSPHARSLHLIEGTIPQALPFPAWGIDPGVNFGLTVIEKKNVYLYYGALTQELKPGAYGLNAYFFLDNIIRTFTKLNKAHRGARMIIEGAAYGSQFGQVLLSEIRTAFYLTALLHSDATTFSAVDIIPPATIRKEVFGSGKTQAGEEWPLLNHNAADSLSMAIYAANLGKEKL